MMDMTDVICEYCEQPALDCVCADLENEWQDELADKAAYPEAYAEDIDQDDIVSGKVLKSLCPECNHIMYYSGESINGWTGKKSLRFECDFCGFEVYRKINHHI